MKQTIATFVLATVVCACQPTEPEQPTTEVQPASQNALDMTLPQYPILHDKTIEQDLWAATHDAIQTCGTTHDKIQVWAVTKKFSRGKSTPNFVISRKVAMSQEEYIQVAKPYFECTSAVLAKYER